MSQTALPQLDIDDPETADDPYPLYHELRATCPVGRSEFRGGFWYLSDYEFVRAAFRTPELMSSAQVRVPYIEDPNGKEIPLQLDGAEHAKWRSILDPLFSLRRVENHRDVIRAQAVELLEDFVAAGEGDIVQSFTIPYPSRIFCLLMGLPAKRLDQYLSWNRDLSKGTSMTDREAAVAGFVAAKESVRQVFAELKEERLRDGFRDDVVSALLQSEVDGRLITDDEYHNICVLLFIAGLETVTATLGNFMWFLAAHPDHRRRLVADPSLVPSAVEELLRFESIVNPGRVVATDTTRFGDQPLRAGDRVVLLTGSAGRDEKIFENPDEVDFERSPNRHLAFGGGPHRCLGSHLARLELRTALEEVCRLLPEFHVTPGARPVRGLGQQKSMETLHLTVGAGPKEDA